MKTQAKANLLIVLVVLTQAAAGMSANDLQDSAPKNRATYLGISDNYPTGSPLISRDRLVAAYDMETLTSDGKLKDYSGNDNHGTIHRTIPVKGTFGQARQFSTASDYIHLPENPLFAIDGPLSVAMWVRVHRLGLHQHMVACDDKFAFWITPGDNIRFVDTLGNGFQSVGGIATATWYSIVGVFKGKAGDTLTADNIAVFINGKPIAGEVFGRPRKGSSNKIWSPGILHKKDACYIGFESHQGERTHQKLQFEGDIDELLIFSPALTLSEVEVHARRDQKQADEQEKQHQ
jgi:concanavalin A-like lectin/glucanase superfamily protein